jgi:leucine dehydrogenase
MSQLSNQSLADFLADLGRWQIRRFHFISDANGRLKASHSELEPLADALNQDSRDQQGHEGLFFQLDSTGNTLMSAFVHKTCRGLAAGGLRYWNYADVDDVLRDGLRLAAGMTRKIALAGLWWGGGKGILARPLESPALEGESRALLYREYGHFITSLAGCYYTAEDVGTGPADMAEVYKTTRFVTCVPPSVGGSGNPSGPTARGVVAGMEAALAWLKMGDIKGKTIAMQGLGHVAQPMLEELFEKGVSRVVATDIDAALVAELSARFAGKPFEARLVSRDDASIYAEKADIFAPCATGAILNPETIPMLDCRIVCGAANNQLQDPVRDDMALVTRDILYVPDFLTNRMGIVNCADEGAGTLSPDPLIERHLEPGWKHSIHQTCLDVFAESRVRGKGPGTIATEMADKLAEELHPVYGHRGKQIITSLS